jgi:hypothetical protein
LIVASPISWAAVSKFKTAEDSNESLLGPAAIAAQRQLLSVPLRVSANVPDDLLLVIDRRAVLSAYGALNTLTLVQADLPSEPKSQNPRTP